MLFLASEWRSMLPFVSLSFWLSFCFREANFLQSHANETGLTNKIKTILFACVCLHTNKPNNFMPLLSMQAARTATRNKKKEEKPTKNKLSIKTNSTKYTSRVLLFVGSRCAFFGYKYYTFGCDTATIERENGFTYFGRNEL